MIQAYNYMLESFPVNRQVKYPANKRSELSKVYKDIVNLSKSSPLYKINLSKENKEYTIGVKEAAIAMKVKIGNMQNPDYSGFKSQSIEISDDRVLSAKLINEDTENFPKEIRLSVDNLAAVQVNKGRELLNPSRGLPKGEYEFRAKVVDQTYQMTYVQSERVENQEALSSFEKFLNQNVPGINATVEKGSAADYSSLVIVADQTGKFGEKTFTFEDADPYNDGVVAFFGMNRVDKAPTYARFKLNGVEKQTSTNNFTLENTLRITMNKSNEKPVSIKIVPDSQKIMNAVDSVLNTYNGLIRLAKNRTVDNNEHYRATKLLSEMKSLEGIYKEELDAVGFKAAEDGSLILEDALAVQAAKDGGMESLFTRENGFIARLLEKAETIAINPMEYLDKTIVTYPNSERNAYRNPYVTSMYSGLFFSSYC